MHVQAKGDDMRAQMSHEPTSTYIYQLNQSTSIRFPIFKEHIIPASIPITIPNPALKELFDPRLIPSYSTRYEFSSFNHESVETSQ